MTVLEKIAIPLCVISAIIMNLMGIYFFGPPWLNVIFACTTIGTLLGLCIYYLIKTKYSLYQVIFGLLALWPLGAFLIIMYWRGFEVFATLQVLAYPVIAVLLLRTALARYRDHKEVRIFYITIALTLLVQFVVAYIPPLGRVSNLSDILDYILLVSLLSMWLYRKVISLPENRVMTLIGLQAALLVIPHIVNLLVKHSFFM